MNTRTNIETAQAVAAGILKFQDAGTIPCSCHYYRDLILNTDIKTLDAPGILLTHQVLDSRCMLIEPGKPQPGCDLNTKPGTVCDATVKPAGNILGTVTKLAYIADRIVPYNSDHRKLPVHGPVHPYLPAKAA